MSEALVHAFHARRPGATHAAFARTGSYALLAEEVEGAGRILDLGCGSTPLPGAIGVDFSLAELRLARGTTLQARAQALPFRDGVFDACISHLAFMLFADVERVVAELARVLRPGATFAALLGGGPPADAPADDAFVRFLARAPLHGAMPGDRRASTEAGWCALFAGWASAPVFERFVVDVGGTFDEAWAFLGASYQLDPARAEEVRAALRAEVGERCACRVVLWLATIRR